MSDLDRAPLGKPVRYASHYDPTLLCPIPRQLKRDEIGLPAGTPLPFHGLDLWNAYELSWLLPSGKPQVALAEFRVPASSPNIIESKSLKLYLNSFNQTRLAARAALLARLQTDLSAAAGAAVGVELIGPERFAALDFGELDGECIDDLDVTIEHYQPAPQLLRADFSAAPVAETLCSNLLKSNCLVTGQPDWASVQIRYRGAPIDRAGLLGYLVSFREHNEFHEQCVERIYMDLLRQCRPQELSVYARYTRRGGLDINPLRSSDAAVTAVNPRGARQ